MAEEDRCISHISCDLEVTYKGVKMSFNSAEEAKEALKVTVLADGEDDA